MSSHIPPLKLSFRIFLLFSNAVVFFAVYYSLNQTVLFTGGLESVWLLSALALWFYALISVPFFVPPKDGLVVAVTSLIMLVTIDLAGTGQFQDKLNIFRWIGVVVCGTISVSSVIALFVHERNPGSPLGKLLYRINALFGSGEVLFSIPLFISVIGTYNVNPFVMSGLFLLWTVFIVIRPIEKLLQLLIIFSKEKAESENSEQVGTIERIDHPDIVRVRLSNSSLWVPGSLHIAALPHDEQNYVLALFKQVQGTDVTGTGLCIAQPQDNLSVNAGDVVRTHDQDKAQQLINGLSGGEGAEIVGFAVENSNIANLKFEVAMDKLLKEGDVVFARIKTENVYYQILDAVTSEESFDQNPHGTHIVNATQLGVYDPKEGFLKYKWLPRMNSPLFSTKDFIFPDQQKSEREFTIGKVPSTGVSVVANVDDLIQFHTAILGVTGTGKTEVALDTIKQALDRGAKVICVDLTGEYKYRLAENKPIMLGPSTDEAKALEDKLFAVETGEYGAPNEKKILQAFIRKIGADVDKQIDEFLQDKNGNLAILELAEISNSKGTLRTTELYLSGIMKWAKANRKAKQILIALEEAHTIIPETAGSGFDFSTQWVVSQIGQIALQGRKYGVGLLVISQRTALVSKTILSQCNTFFTHSLIDHTSLSFLDGIYSSQHTKLIPNLAKYQFLAFGKAIKSERPIVVQRDYDPELVKACEAMNKTIEN